jgi:hypothetical protein
MLYYYVIHEEMSYDHFPQIFSPQFLFVHLGALSAQLLVHPDHYLEGFNLLTKTLNKVDPGSISLGSLVQPSLLSAERADQGNGLQRTTRSAKG